MRMFTAAMLLAGLLLTGCEGKKELPKEKIRYSAFASKVRGLDPMHVADTTSAAVASQIYECLYQYHYLKRPYELIPALAAAMPEVSDDGLTYTIRLRDDVVFSDDPCFPGGKGRKLTSADFVFSWKRIADVKNVCGNWSFLEGRIVGLDDFREHSKQAEGKKAVDYSRAVEGLQTPDDRTLVIRLTRPWPQLLYVMAHLPTAPVPREAVEKYGDEFLNHPVGTGPFVLKDWVRGSRISLRRNPTFRDEVYPSEGEEGDREAGLLEAAGRKLPLIDGMEISIIQEDQPYWLTFMKGAIDIAGIPKDNFAQAIGTNRELTPEMAAKGIVLTKTSDPSTFWYAFNMEDPVVGKNLPLRRAMSMALNRPDYIELFMNNRGMPARGLFPPDVNGYDESLQNPYSEFNLEKAKELLKEAEKVHGGPLPAVKLHMGGTDTTQRQAGEYLKLAWEKAGLKVQPEYSDWPTLQRLVDEKSAQMFGYGWQGDYPDAENFLFLFYSKNRSPGPNSTNYSNPKFDELFEKAVVMPPGPERLKLYRELEKIVVDDLPVVFTMHRVVFSLRHPWLKNVKEHAWGSGLLKYQDIDQEMRFSRVGR